MRFLAQTDRTFMARMGKVKEKSMDELKFEQVRAPQGTQVLNTRNERKMETIQANKQQKH